MVHQPSVVHPDTVIFLLVQVKASACLPSSHRYVSIALLTVSNFGYFYHGFSAKACSRYYLASPILKGEPFGALRHIRHVLTPSAVIQIMISQAIVGYRAWNIAQRSKDSGIFLLVFGFVITVLEWYANLGSRTPVQVDWKYAYRPPWGYPAIRLIFTG